MEKTLMAIGGATILGLGYLFYEKNQPEKISISYPKEKPSSFQIFSEDEMHPDQHPEQTTSADTIICTYQMACDLTYLFDMFGVNAWVSGAALLGTIRHAGLIPWDSVLEFFCYQRDEDALGQLFLTNTLRSYGYQAVPIEGGWMFYLGANPDVRAMFYWVNPAESEIVCPSGDLGRNSPDEACGVMLEAVSEKLRNTPHHGYLGMVNEIEPRRKWAFGMTQVYVPSQFEAILNRQEGANWREMGDDPSLSPSMNRLTQNLAWYRAPRILCERDYRPATPIGPLQFADRGIMKVSRDVDIKGKYGI